MCPGARSMMPATSAAARAGIIERAPGHISYYQLTLEPGTPFHHRPPARPDDDTLADIFERSADAMRRAGYRQYEVSAWARPDAVCRHNYNYWTFGDYLAIGAGAHAKLTSADGHITRRARQRWPRAYMAAAGTPAMLSASHQLDFGDRSFEFLLNGLRLKDGV